MINISFGEKTAADILKGQDCAIIPHNLECNMLYPGLQAGFALKLYGWVDGDPRRLLGLCHTTTEVQRIVIGQRAVKTGIDELRSISPKAQRRIAKACGFRDMDEVRKYFHVTEKCVFKGLVITFKMQKHR